MSLLPSAAATVRAVAKWTIRTDDDIADDFAEMCAVNGVTQNAMIEALVEHVVSRHRNHGRQPMLRWIGSPEVLDAYGALVDRALAISARKRSRRPTA